MDKLSLRQWLLLEAEPKFKKFSSALIPGCTNVLGVRLPKLRAKAKEISRGNWHEFLSFGDFDYMEEYLLQGMVIGLVKVAVEERLRLVEDYIPKITNWSLCDSFCCGLKFTTENRERVWHFLQPYLRSDKEFELRFAVVMLLNFYVTDEWIDCVLDTLFSLKSEFYYAQMGIAWAISVCMVKYFDKTYSKLGEVCLPAVILKKSIQKSCESFRLTSDRKIILREYLGLVKLGSA